jgi:hypothetical protein
MIIMIIMTIIRLLFLIMTQTRSLIKDRPLPTMMTIIILIMLLICMSKPTCVFPYMSITNYPPYLGCLFISLRKSQSHAFHYTFPTSPPVTSHLDFSVHSTNSHERSIHSLGRLSSDCHPSFPLPHLVTSFTRCYFYLM